MPQLKKRRKHASKNPPTLFILAGIALLLIAVFTFKSVSSPASPATLEAELDHALQANRPTFVFMHSLDCIPCKEMMGVVAQVYPEFQNAVILIDVDIYQPSNENILRRENLQSIPTLVFYDAQGTRQVFVGAMPAEQFHAALTALKAGN